MSALPFAVRPICPADRAPLASLLRQVEQFAPAEVDVALELIDGSLGEPPGSDYVTVVAADGPEGAGPLLGYACFGPTPMTLHTWDLYWIAVDPAAQGRGIGRALLAAVEATLAARGGRIVRIETSSQEAYGGTLAFYERTGYRGVGRIEDFYKPGDDLLTFTRRLPG